MNDLISRQAAIDALNEYFARIGKLKRRGLTKGEKAISLDTVGAIKTLPSAEPERKKGKWKREVLGSTSGYGTTIMYQCSACERMSISKYSFCPNCGADMRGEEDATD